MTIEGDYLVDTPRRVPRIQVLVARELDRVKARQHVVGRAARIDLLDVHGGLA
jgi:hypothetical protein